MTFPELTGVIGAITILLGSIAAIYKLRPDRDVLMITQAQGASTILNDLVETLREEVLRERGRITELEAENRKLEQEVQAFREQVGDHRRNE